MANRRMFARTVTNSGRFLRLSGQSRLLYYDLGMEADDDGFVEAYVRLAVTGSGEENLAELEKAGFIRICDRENLVVYILDWQKNNLIRADRYNPSIYKDMYLPEAQQKPEAAAQVREEQKSEPIDPSVESEPEETVNQVETICHPDGCFLGDTRLTQIRLGKIRLDQFRLAQDRLATGEPRARDGWDEKSASPKIEEAEISFEIIRRNSFLKLLNSEYFKKERASPGNPIPV